MTRTVLRIFPLFLTLLATACTEPSAVTGGDGVAVQFSPATLTTSVVMNNLNSPRGLAFAPNGGLYVAEAGATVINGPCVPAMEGAQLVTRCFSGTGSVSRLWMGRQERVLSGLASSFFVETGFSSGPQAISFQGMGNGLIAMGCGCTIAERSGLGPAAALQGTVIDFNPASHVSLIADILEYENAANPAGGGIDSNPFGVLADGQGAWLVDAGGNSLLHLSKKGDVSYLTTFPSTPAMPPFNLSEAVPTRVRKGPDGALYVSTLSGAPFHDGSAAIYRVVPGQAPTLWAGGFKAITDFAFAPDGSVFVVQFASGPVFFVGPGMLIRRSPDDTRTVIAADLFHPTGVAVGPDGSVYVSNRGTSNGGGEVLRYQW